MTYRAGAFERYAVTFEKLGSWYAQVIVDEMGGTQHDIAVVVETATGPVKCWIPVGGEFYSDYPDEEDYARAINRARALSPTGDVRSVLKTAVK